MSEVTNRRHSGTWTAMGRWGELTEGQTLSCCHCGGAWVLAKGSGRTRGFCTNCMGYVCGPACAACVPYERQIENVEAGRAPDAAGPVKIFVPPGLE